MFKRSMEFIGKVVIFFLLVLSCSSFFGCKVYAYDVTYTDDKGYNYVYNNNISRPVSVVVPLSDATLVKTDNYSRYYFYRYDFTESFTVTIMSQSGEFFHGDRPTTSYISYDLRLSTGDGVIDSVESSFTAPGVYTPLSPSGGWFEAGSDSTPTAVGYVNFIVHGHIDISFTVSKNDTSTVSLRSFNSRYYTFNLGMYLSNISASPLMSTVLTINDNVIKLLNDQGLTGAINNQTNVIQGGINQAHQDMDKVNDSLTNFSGSGALDASKTELDGVISDYDKVEGILFDTSQDAFDKFDPSSLLDFSVGITSAIAYISQLMVGIITAMGEFSVIYTVGFVLVFFGMLIGIWRFFIDD